MTVEVSVFLFGKPAWEIEGLEGGELTEDLIKQIEKKGKEINQSLDEASDALRRLMKKGWSGTGSLYDVILFKDVPLGEARRELAEMGLDPELAHEFEDDEENGQSTPPLEQ